jgi:hypothetical protein
MENITKIRKLLKGLKKCNSIPPELLILLIERIIDSK